MGEAMITTTDNPYSPFTQFDKWMQYDEAQGYNTAKYLARIAKTSDELSDADNELAIDEAMSEIVELNTTGVKGVNYIKVYQDDVI